MDQAKLQEILLSKLPAEITPDQLLEIYRTFTANQGPAVYRGLHISTMTQAEFDRLAPDEKEIQYTAVKTWLFPEPDSDEDEEDEVDPASSPPDSPRTVKANEELQAKLSKTYPIKPKTKDESK